MNLNARDSIIRSACRRSKLSPTAKMILAKLVYTCGKDGKIEIGRDLLASIFNIDHRNVTRAVNELVATGVLDRVKRGGGKGRRTSYMIKGWQLDTLSSSQTVAIYAPKGCHITPPTGKDYAARSTAAAGAPTGAGSSAAHMIKVGNQWVPSLQPTK